MSYPVQSFTPISHAAVRYGNYPYANAWGGPYAGATGYGWAPTVQTTTWNQFQASQGGNAPVAANTNRSNQMTQAAPPASQPEAALRVELLKQQLKNEKMKQTNSIIGLGMSIGLFALFPLVGWYLFKRAKKNQADRTNNGPEAFTNSDKYLVTNLPDVRLDDIQGIDTVKNDAKDLVERIKQVKGKNAPLSDLPKGVLFTGPAGTGKTMMAQAIAKEAEVPFYSLTGSSFVEMYVGVGASRVRNLFEEARKNAPCIIFIDELDSLGRTRSTGKESSSNANDEREGALNQLLTELQGTNNNSGIILISATNRAEILDKPLLDRFDRKYAIPAPATPEQRKAILKSNANRLALQVDEAVLEEWSQQTAGLNGRSLEQIVKEAKEQAKQRLATAARGPATPLQASREDFLQAFLKTQTSAPRQEFLNDAQFMNNLRQREILGPALLCYLMDIPIHSINLEPRGDMAKGEVFYDRSRFERPDTTRQLLMQQLLILQASQAAELHFNGEDGITVAGSRAGLSPVVKATLEKLVPMYAVDPPFQEMFPGTLIHNARAVLEQMYHKLDPDRAASLLEAFETETHVTGWEDIKRRFDDVLGEQTKAELQAELESFYSTPKPSDSIHRPDLSDIPDPPEGSPMPSPRGTWSRSETSSA